VEVIFLYLAGLIFIIIVIVSLLKMLTTRASHSLNDVKVEIAHLTKRINELEDRLDERH